jgi:hypothetical protein
MYYYHAVDVVVVLELKRNSITNGKRQNADPMSMTTFVDLVHGLPLWTTDHSSGPLSWTTCETPDFGGLNS